VFNPLSSKLPSTFVQLKREYADTGSGTFKQISEPTSNIPPKVDED
jgi:hypothetical protein